MIIEDDKSEKCMEKKLYRSYSYSKLFIRR